MAKKFEKLPLVDVREVEMRINPRKTMEVGTLLHEVVKDGEIKVPVVLWDLPASIEQGSLDAGVYERLSLPQGHRWVAICGHRRLTVAKLIVEGSNKYTADLIAAVKCLPANVFIGSEAEAREMANDDGGKSFLCKADTVEEILRLLGLDYTWQSIAEKMTQYCYHALLSNGEGKHKKACEILDGSERRKKILADLKNVLDQHIKSAHLLGSAVADQVIEWFRQKRDGHKAKAVLLLDWKLETLRELREAYTDTAKADETFTPITKIEWVDNDVVIEGGSVKINALLTKKLRLFRFPEEGASDNDKPELPKASDRDAVKMSSRSQAGKLTAMFYCGGNSEARAKADEEAFYLEQRADALRLCKPVSTEMQALQMHLLDGKYMDDLKAVFDRIDEILVATENAAAEAAKAKGGKKK